MTIDPEPGPILDLDQPGPGGAPEPPEKTRRYGRWVAVLGAVVATVALGAGASYARASFDRPAAPPAPAALQPGSALAPGSAVAPGSALAPVRSAPTKAAGAGPESLVPLGDVVRTGITGPAGEVVLYGVAIANPAIPLTHFGVVAGYRDSAGRITAAVLVNESSGADDTPGFHATEGALNGAPEFGYYVGPAARITGKVAGRSVTAGQGVWSQDPRVVLFWFAPADLRGQDTTSLAAVDAAGHPLPAGHSQLGHG